MRIHVVHVDERGHEAVDRCGRLNEAPDIGPHVVEAVVGAVVQVEHDDLGADLTAEHVARNRNDYGVADRETGAHPGSILPNKMSGISGAWNIGGEPIDARVIGAMSERLRHRGPDGDRTRRDGSVGFSCQHLWVAPEDHQSYQPIVGPSGAMLVMDGRLDNRDTLVAALGLEPGVTDAWCALSAYERWTDTFAARLDGDFAIAIFDPLAQRVMLARDAMGTRPLYYFHSPRLFAFGSEIGALLAHPDITPLPDSEGVADVMLLGSRPVDSQHTTCFQGISAVPPAHTVAVTRSGISRARYWDFDTERQLRYRSFEEYAEAFGAHFREAVKRRTRSKHPVGVSVSGGLDSSSIFCQAETLRRSGVVRAPAIHGVSYVSSRDGTDEQSYVRDIELKYGLDVERFSAESLLGIADGVDEQVATAEAPFVEYLWGVTRELHARAGAAGARSLLSGHLGDQVLFSPAYLIDLLGRGALPTIWRHTRAHEQYFGAGDAVRRRKRLVADAVRHHTPRALATPLKWARRRVFEHRRPQRWFSPRFLATALRDRYRVATFDREFHSAHARAVYTEARSNYHVRSIEWNVKVAARFGIDAAFPFFDRDLVSFLISIPGEMSAQEGVPRALLRRALDGVLPGSIRARTWKADFTPLVNKSVRDDVPAIMRTMKEDSLGVRFGYFDGDHLVPAIEEVANRIGASDCTDSWDLADTYGLEIWLRVFWGGKGRGMPPPPA
jgi:asparagine synthase (glutamine-hydrolysing)